MDNSNSDDEPDQLEINLELIKAVNKKKTQDNDKQKKYIKNIKKALDKHADVNFKDRYRNGNTPLHLAIKNNNEPIVKYLLEIGASLEIKNHDKKNALQFAENLKQKTKSGSAEELEYESIIVALKQDKRSEKIEPQPKNRKDTDLEGNVINSQKLNVENIEFTTSGLFTVYGTEYQLNLLMLFALKFFKEGYKYHLLSEINAAGKYDDIVLQFTKPNDENNVISIFLQAKHSQNDRELPVKEFLGKKNENFALHKYFKSYQEIKKSRLFNLGKENYFIVNTNYKFEIGQSVDSKDAFLSHFKSIHAPIEEINLGGKYNKIVEKRNEAVSTLKQLFEDTSDFKKNKQTIPEVNVEEIECFLNDFFLASDQPNGEQLFELVKKEIVENHFKCTDADIIANDLRLRMSYWLKPKGLIKSKTQNDMKNFLVDWKQKLSQFILIGPTLTNISNLEKTKIVFRTLPPELKAFLKPSKSIENKLFCLVTSNTFLGCIKVNQAIKHVSDYSNHDNFIFISSSTLLNLQQEVQQAFGKERTNLLIVELKPNVEISDSLCNDLSAIMNSSANKRILLIAPSNDPSVERFKHRLQTEYQELVDESCFIDLTSKSQEDLLEQKCQFQENEVTLKDLFSIYDEAVIDSISLSDLVDQGTRITIGKPAPSSLGYNKNYYIDRTFQQQDTNDQNLNIFSTQDLVEQFQEKIMIISDEAGMGKSTVFTHLSHAIKSKNQNDWVVRIDLNQHTKAFSSCVENDVSFNPNSAIDFISKDLLDVKYPLEMEVFKKKIKEHQVVLMLDGFDEICPKYEEQVLNLIRNVKRTVKKLWVTTRPHLKKLLMESLKQNVCYNLKPFSEDNQIEFLIKFWSEGLEFQEENQHLQLKELTSFANELIDKLRKSISDGKQIFTDNRLHIFMLANVYKVNSFDQSNKPKLNICDLYDQFFKDKYCIYFEEKNKIDASNQGIDEMIKKRIKEVTQIYQQLALKILFPDIAGLLEGIKLQTQENFDRIGITLIDDKGNHNFIHRTFAEYFAAQFFAKNFIENNLNQFAQTFFLTDILTKSDCTVIRCFVNNFIKESQIEQKNLENLGELLDKLLEKNTLKTNCQTFLHIAAKNDCSHIIKLIFESLNSRPEIFKEISKLLLLARNLNGELAWHVAAEFDSVEVLETLFAWARRIKSNADDFDLTIEHFAEWFLASECHNAVILEKIWKFGKELDITDKENKGNPMLSTNFDVKHAFHYGARKGNVQILKAIKKFAEEIGLDFKNKIFLSTDDSKQNALHIAASNHSQEVMNQLLMWSKEMEFTSDELNVLFPSKTNV